MPGTGRILAIVTTTSEFEQLGHRTGLWLSELTHFQDIAEAAGYTVDIASPQGGTIPIDPESLIMTEMGAAIGLKGDVQKRYENRAFMNTLKNTPTIDSMTATPYDALYLAGGHGAMFDFPHNPALAALVKMFHETGKIIAAVCHGPSGLLNVRLADGTWLITGRQVTGFSWQEEIAAKRDAGAPFSLEERLQEHGGQYSKSGVPFAAHVVESGTLITGQNPRSAHGVAEAVIRKLDRA